MNKTLYYIFLKLTWWRLIFLLLLGFNSRKIKLKLSNHNCSSLKTKPNTHIYKFLKATIRVPLKWCKNEGVYWKGALVPTRPHVTTHHQLLLLRVITTIMTRHSSRLSISSFYDDSAPSDNSALFTKSPTWLHKLHTSF